MRSAPPLFSIIVPVYNSGSLAAEAVHSVLEQTIDDWELLLVDDCSTDGTFGLLDPYVKRDSRIKTFRTAVNEGPARARNLAIEKASGRYMAFLDSDDLWRPEKLEAQLALLEQTRAPLVYSAYEILDPRRRRTKRVVPVPESIDYRRLLNATVIATVTAVYDTAPAGKIFMPDILKRQDYALWLRILRPGGTARAVTRPLAFLRKRPGSVSSNKLSAVRYTWRVYREMENLSMPKSLYHFVNYCVRAFAKTL